MSLFGWVARVSVLYVIYVECLFQTFFTIYWVCPLYDNVLSVLLYVLLSCYAWDHSASCAKDKAHSTTSEKVFPLMLSFEWH